MRNDFAGSRNDSARFLASATRFYNVPRGARVGLLSDPARRSEIAVSVGPNSLDAVPASQVVSPPSVQNRSGDRSGLFLSPGENPATVASTWRILPSTVILPRDAIDFRGPPELVRLRRTYEYKTNGLDFLVAVVRSTSFSTGVSESRWSDALVGRIRDEAEALQLRHGAESLILAGLGSEFSGQSVSAVRKYTNRLELTPSILAYVALRIVGAYNGMYEPIDDGSGWFGDAEIPDESSLRIPFLGETLTGARTTPDRRGRLISVGVI